jgi:hypothetical protein
LDQTPVHDQFNPDLLRLMPAGLNRVVEVGSSSGALTREYKRANPNCQYTGVEIDESYAKLSRRFCDRVIVGNIEQMDDAAFGHCSPPTCSSSATCSNISTTRGLLKRTRAGSDKPIFVAACIPNAQHWSMQASLSVGVFVYQDMGLFDRTHIR